MQAIQAANLTKRYGRTNAVDSVSFQVEPGEIVGFLGPNGAGKTTTLRMLAGLIRPSAGQARILERPVPSAALRQVGTMIEEPSFYPYMTGRGNLRHAALLHGGVPERRIDEVLAFVRMEQAADKRVAAYSQGMRQRLGLARALLHRPRVLLLDEPTNGLDPVGIAEFRESLRATARAGVTILVSSHILAEIEKLADRVLAIEGGQLLFDGPLQQLLRRIDARAIGYLIEASDGEALQRALTELGYAPEALDARRVRAAVPLADTPRLAAQLVERGVELLELRRESDNLEGAYLKLLQRDGRPS